MEERVDDQVAVAGAEVGGAVKNVLAIACGVVEGKGLGQNARAALIGRGFAEMTRFGLACGARRETLAGLAGLGDLVLTCTGDLSRNRPVGLALGRGQKLKDVLAGMTQVAEGVKTARSARDLSRKVKDIDGVSLAPASLALFEGLYTGASSKE